MAMSQNGWVANDRSLIESQLIPGTEVRVTVRKGAAGAVLLYVASQVDARVEDIDNARGHLDDWGYAERPIRGNPNELSNHASGTALDLNATRHALGHVGTFTPGQVQVIHAILREVGGVVRWGGDYHGRKDEMHFEIVGTPSQVEAAAQRLAGHEEDDMICKYGDGSTAKPDQWVRRLQHRLNITRTTYGVVSGAAITEDGIYRGETRDALKAFLAEKGLVSDGMVYSAREQGVLESYINWADTLRYIDARG